MLGPLIAFAPLFGVLNYNQLWYAVPLIVVISLVYGATRHENLKEILIQTYRSAVWVIGFMAIIFAVIFVAGYWN